tara:strand:+ start:625 stop:939 length:315 start_codon:yes stop_codon:yes gene_type:complete
MKLKKQNRRVVCNDGYSVSIQASRTNYCSPRVDDAFAYESVELGFPSSEDYMILQYAENENQPTETVYGYVPVDDVYLLLTKHGGVIEGDVPKGVPVYGGVSYG